MHKVSKATVEILLNLFVHSCFLLYLLCHLYLPLIVFEWLLLCFTRFSGSSPCISIVKFGNTAPLQTEVGGTEALTGLMHYPPPPPTPLNLFTLSSGVGNFFYIDCFGTEMSKMSIKLLLLSYLNSKNLRMQRSTQLVNKTDWFFLAGCLM